MPDYVVPKDAQPGTVTDTTEILITPGTSTVVITYMDAAGVVQTLTLSNATAVNNSPTWVVPTSDPGFASSPATGFEAIRLWADLNNNLIVFNGTDSLGNHRTGQFNFA